MMKNEWAIKSSPNERFYGVSHISNPTPRHLMCAVRAVHLVPRWHTSGDDGYKSAIFHAAVRCPGSPKLVSAVGFVWTVKLR